MRDDTQSKPQPEPIVTGDSTVLQPGLFTGAPTVIAEPPDPTTTPFPPLVRTNPLTDQSSLAACALPYQQELIQHPKPWRVVSPSSGISFPGLDAMASFVKIHPRA